MIDIYKDEKWLDINVLNIAPTELIQISNYGRLRSMKVSKIRPKIIGGSWIGGYNAIVLKMEDGKSKTFYVHRLVASHFLLKPRENETNLIHLDYDKKNNHYSNLKWVTSDFASYHKHADENYDVKKVRNSKLTENQVRKIKKMLKRGTIKPFRIAQQFGISQTQLSRIRNGQQWSHIEV